MRARKAKDRFTWRSYAVCGAALLLAAVALFFHNPTGGRARRPAPTPAPRRPAAGPDAVKPAPEFPAAPVREVSAPSHAVRGEDAAGKPSVADAPAADREVTPGHSRVRAAPPAGARRVVFADGTEGEIRPRRLFKNRFDSALLGAGRPGGMTTGLRALLARLGDEGFMEMLRAPVEVVDGADEYARETGEAVARFKRDLLAYIGEGATPEQAVAELSARSAEERGMRVEAIRQLNAIVRSGDGDAARRYVEEVNALFEEKGMAPLRRTAGDAPERE